MDDNWAGRIDEKVKHIEVEVLSMRNTLEIIRTENQACRMELKNDIHDLAKWRERVLVYLVIGGFITVYAAKLLLDAYFE